MDCDFSPSSPHLLPNGLFSPQNRISFELLALSGLSGFSTFKGGKMLIFQWFANSRIVREFPPFSFKVRIATLTRNQFDGDITWVRIPPAAPQAPGGYAPGAFFMPLLRPFVDICAGIIYNFPRSASTWGQKAVLCAALLLSGCGSGSKSMPLEYLLRPKPGHDRVVRLKTEKSRERGWHPALLSPALNSFANWTNGLCRHGVRLRAGVFALTRL